MTPHISDQLGTENACETLLCWIIIMIWVLVCTDMYWYEHRVKDRRWFLPLRLRYTPLHDIKGPGKQSKRYCANFSARRPQSREIPALGMWRLPWVYCANDITDVNEARYPKTCWKPDTVKSNARCFIVVSAIIESWHTQFRHVKYLWFGKRLQEHYNALPIAESRTGKPTIVTLKIKLNCSMVHDTTLLVSIYKHSHLGCGTDSVFIRFCRSHKYFKDAKAMQLNRILMLG